MVQAIVFIFLLLFVILLVFQVRAEQKWRLENHGRTIINEKGNYYFLGLYVNISDKRIFVPKKSGGGYTFNFGNPIGLILFLITVAVVVYLFTL